MSTRARIEYESESTWTSVHWDGYPSRVGAILIAHHGTAEKAKAICSRGAIRQLLPDGAVEEYDDPRKENAVDYTYRWQGGRWTVWSERLHDWLDLAPVVEAEKNN